MITSTMTRQEADREIYRVLPGLMQLVLNKSKHRERQAKKKSYPNVVSSYEVEGVRFLVYYFFANGADANAIFCRYHDTKGAVYTYVVPISPHNVNTLHFLKHALDRYNDRLKLGLKNAQAILFHMARHGMTMVRQEMSTVEENLMDVGWKSQNGLWLGDYDKISHVSTVNTFIHDPLVRPDQEAILDEDALERLAQFEQELGGDAYARRWISQLIDIFKRQR